MERTFMFTIATNGYDTIFADWLETQREYADRYGYKYIAIRQVPPWGISASASAWLKIPIILNAMQKGYEWIFFIDADCKIESHTPSLESIYVPGKSIYMCHDISGCINSGVIIVKNNLNSIRFFRKVLLFCDVPGKILGDSHLYENGHMIHFGKHSPDIEIIDKKWNNNTGIHIGEYIWHGRGRYAAKPRAKNAELPESKNMLTAQVIIKRFLEGSRYLLLRRLVHFYEKEYRL